MSLGGRPRRGGARRPGGTFAEALLAVPPSVADPPAAAPGVRGQAVPRAGPGRGRPRHATGPGRTETDRLSQVAVFRPSRTNRAASPSTRLGSRAWAGLSGRCDVLASGQCRARGQAVVEHEAAPAVTVMVSPGEVC